MLWMWLKRVGCLNEWLVFKIENLYAKRDGLNVTHRHTKSIVQIQWAHTSFVHDIAGLIIMTSKYLSNA